MFKKYLVILAVFMAFSSLALAQIDQIAIFNEAVGWTDVATAKAATDKIIASVKSAKSIKVYTDAEMANFAKANTKDGNFDLIILFGYFPVSLYTPGNAQKDGSVGELFLEGGDMFLNTADYVFYVTQGGGANAAAGLQNMTDTTFDCWTDGTTCKPTDNGKKFTPSLPASYNAPRCFRKDQIDAQKDWILEMGFGSNGANNFDPAIIKHQGYGGRVGIVFQVSDNTMPRGPVMSEMIENYIAKQIPGGTAVKPGDKLASTWGYAKRF